MNQKEKKDEIFKGMLITTVYYVVVCLISFFALEAYPSNGGPSEAVLLLAVLILLSIVIFIYCFVRFLKGDTSKTGSFIIHLIAMVLFVFLLSRQFT